MGVAGAHPRKLIVVSAPSGAGKTTIARAILARFPGTTFSVSATTRPKREAEVDGVDYYFLERGEFRRRVEAGEFVEWEEIYGQYYGTLVREVERGLNSGHIILFDVDVKGALSIKRRYPEALLLFIRPPSVEVLLERLRNRRTEDTATVAKRMERVPLELTLGARFDHQIVNDVLETAIAEVETIVADYIHPSS
jgi:guanylate kinase